MEKPVRLIRITCYSSDRIPFPNNPPIGIVLERDDASVRIDLPKQVPMGIIGEPGGPPFPICDGLSSPLGVISIHGLPIRRSGNGKQIAVPVICKLGHCSIKIHLNRKGTIPIIRNPKNTSPICFLTKQTPL